LKRIIITCLLTSIILVPAIAFAQDVISTDILVDNSTGSIIEDQVVAAFKGANTVANITSLGLPSSADIAALHYIDATTILFTLKSAAQLGQIAVGASDVLQWKGGDITNVVTGAELGLGPATGIDALTKNGDALVFSIDISDTVNGVSVSDSDLLTWSSGNPTRILLDQSVCGIPHEADLTGVHLIDTGQYLMTFSSSTVVGGVPTRRGDIMKCDPNTKTVTLYRRFSDLGDSWASVSLDAISQSSDDFIIFKNSFEN
jgi:hypothetical protein